MTADFNALIRRRTFEENTGVQPSGVEYLHLDGNLVVRGKKKIQGVVTERGVFWNGRLIIPETWINGTYLSLENIYCTKENNGIRREGLIYNGKLIRGSLIHSSQTVFSGEFDEKERLIKGTVTKNISTFPHAFEGTFRYRRLEEMILIECQGTMTYAVSKYQESGTFQFGDHALLIAKTDRLGRKIIGRLTFPEYTLDGVFTYSPNGNNILCEGTKICSDGSYKALGVFVNGTQLKGNVSPRGKAEEPLPDQIQGNEWLLEDFMAQDEVQDFHAYCNQIRSIPPFRLYLEM